MTSDDWCIVVLKCKSDNVENLLVDFYSFVEDLTGVRDLHFLIRDRVENAVVFSFRVLVESKEKKVVKSKIAFKLRKSIPEDEFAIDPGTENPLAKYVAWSPVERIAKYGKRKFARFCKILSQMSRLVIEMARKNYFSSAERVELAHVISWMLGCTEYGLWSKKHVEIGYHDRITDKSYAHIKQSLGE